MLCNRQIMQSYHCSMVVILFAMIMLLITSCENNGVMMTDYGHVAFSDVNSQLCLMDEVI